MLAFRWSLVHNAPFEVYKNATIISSSFVFLHHHKGYVSVICYAGRLVELDTKRHAMIRTNGSSVSPWGKAALAVYSCAQR